MDNFQSSVEPPKQPFGMRVVGTGVIVSCLLLSSLFAWGIYLDLQRKDCIEVVDQANEYEISLVDAES